MFVAYINFKQYCGTISVRYFLRVTLAYVSVPLDFRPLKQMNALTKACASSGNVSGDCK
jgi:hypothetical protein